MEIHAETFKECMDLQTLPNFPFLEYLGNDAFNTCTSLTHFNIGNELDSIHLGTFYGCTALTEITIPNNVVGIESAAFLNCTNLRKLRLSESLTTLEIETFLNCNAIDTLVIPNSVSTIKARAFYNCQAARFLSIGSGVTEIESDAFSSYENNSFQHIVIQANTPPTLETEYCFGGMTHDVLVTVPCGTKATYEAAAFWSDFTNMVEDCDGIAEETMQNVQVYAVSGQIVIEGIDGGEVTIYDMSGRVIQQQTIQKMGKMMFKVPTTGIYLVVLDKKVAKKVFVM